MWRPYGHAKSAFLKPAKRTLSLSSLLWLLPLLVLLLSLLNEFEPSSSYGVTASAAKPPLAQRRAGILYEVWHTPAAQMMQRLQAIKAAPLTTELVIRSDGNLTLSDVYAPLNAGGGGDIYNVQPQLGFYCLYRARVNDTTPPLAPDCPNITQTARSHAEMLTAAGFDYVVVDLTNWPGLSPKTELDVTRPLEVLCEEWAALRRAGVTTPDIAVWPSARCSNPPPGSSLPPKTCSGPTATWQWVLDKIYNNPEFSDLIFRLDGGDGAIKKKKALFFPDHRTPAYANASLVAEAERNGGRNDVAVTSMWAMFGQSDYERGTWGFFSFCLTPSGKPDTSMVGVSACAQYSSRDAHNSSNIASFEVSASGSYMTAQCALPFGSPGHLRGLTLQRLFTKVLATGAPYLFVSSFNEHIGGRQQSVFRANTAINMGLPYDPQNRSVWVDTYASEFSRDLEPTVEGGDRVWRVVSSCVKLYKTGKTCSDAAASDEPCCTRADKAVFGNVWALRRRDNGDSLLTTSPAEVAALTTAGGDWDQCCNPVPGPSVFCVNTSLIDAREAPFMLYNVTVPDVETRPLLRCITAKGLHFFSVDPACEDLGSVESTLGHVATARGGEMLRALRRCRSSEEGAESSSSSSSGHRWHSLDLLCDTPDGNGEVLGFVR